MRKMSNHFGILGAAVAILTATSVASAAIVTLDVRLAGGGKNTAVANILDVVNMELHAVVTNLDNDHTNDGFLLLHGSNLSVEVGGLLLGNLSPMIFATPLIDTTLSTVGTQNNLDGNVADLEVGGLSPTSATGYIVASAGVATKFGVGAGGGATDFLLGTFSWTATAITGSLTDINFQVRPKTDGTLASRQLVKVTSDGVASLLTPADVGNNVLIGEAVHIQVPEPAALGLLSVGLMGLLARRRTA